MVVPCVEFLERQLEHVSEHLLHVCLLGPLERRSCALRRRRHELRHFREDVADAAVPTPGSESHPPARLAHAGQLGGETRVIGREDHTNRRRDDVKRCVRIVECLAVGDLEPHIEP